MSDSYLRLRNIRFFFRGPKTEAELDFQSGVNVICGASDTGKSFLADSIDFMLGGSALKEIRNAQSMINSTSVSRQSETKASSCNARCLVAISSYPT